MFTIIWWNESQFRASLNTLNNLNPLKIVRDISSFSDGVSVPSDVAKMSSVNEIITIKPSN